MKKVLIFTLILLLVFPSVIAMDIVVNQKSSDNVLIADLNNPTTFILEITNLENTDEFNVFNLLGFVMNPVDKFIIKEDETKEIEVTLYPKENMKERGAYILTYFVKSSDGSTKEEKLNLEVIDLKDAFEIGSGEIDPESSSMEVFIKNKVNFDFPDLDVKFTSNFFDFSESFSLEPKETKKFDIVLDREDFKKLMAGFYTLKANLETMNQSAEIEGTIKFLEKDITTTTKRDFGFVISTKIIEKTNKGNTIIETETVIEKNIISRLFASFNPEPDIVERKGTKITYTWNNKINPGETLQIKVKTNWLFPFIIILLIVAIVILSKQYSDSNLYLKKRVGFVRTKGGEFALKVTISVHAKRYLENVNIIDRLPSLVKIHERFGSEEPTRIDEKNRRVEWNYEKLEAGEIRFLTYIVYSKVGVLGKFSLPAAKAIYEKEGKIKESESNKAFFVSEQAGKDVEED